MKKPEIIFNPGDLVKVLEPDFIPELDDKPTPNDGYFYGLVLHKILRNNTFGILYSVLVDMDKCEMWWDEMEKITQ